MADIEALSLEMMNTPSKWGRWPLLPVVRDYKSDPNSGVMVYGILRVYHEILRDVPSVEYDSLEAIIEDGWKVD